MYIHKLKKNSQLKQISMKINFNTNYQVFGNNVVKCTSVCTLSNCNELMYTPVFRGYTIKLNSVNKKLVQSFTVTSIAKCNPNDKFNLETGKRIAESRARTKALRLIYGLIEKDRKYFAEVCTKLLQDSNKVWFTLTNEQDHLDNLTK